MKRTTSQLQNRRAWEDSMRFIYCQLFTTPRELHAIAAHKRSQVHSHWCTVFIKNIPPLEGTCWSKIAFPIEEADDTNITLHLAALKQLQQTIRETDEKKWEKKGSFPLTEQSQSPSYWPSPSLFNSCFSPSLKQFFKWTRKTNDGDIITS